MDFRPLEWASPGLRLDSRLDERRPRSGRNDSGVSCLSMPPSGDRSVVSRLHPNLELQNEGGDVEWSWHRAMDQLDETRSRVALENRLAADSRELLPDSPHLTLANQVASRLQGAMLAPEDRAVLVDEARRMGIREFDSHLVMAVVQDRARRGEGMDDLRGPLSMFTASPASSVSNHLRIVIAAVGLGLAIGTATLFVRWLTGI